MFCRCYAVANVVSVSVMTALWLLTFYYFC